MNENTIFVTGLLGKTTISLIISNLITFPFNFALLIPQRVLVLLLQYEILWIIMNNKFQQQQGLNHSNNLCRSAK